MSEKEVKLYGSTVVKTRILLDYLSIQAKGASLANLSKETGITKSTVRKIMDTLVYMSWVHEDESGVFTLGIGMIRYGEAARSQFNFVSTIEPFLRKLSECFGETVNFVVPDGNHVVLMQKYEGTHSVALKSIIGGSMDLYCTSVGKSVLATYSDSELRHYMQNNELVAKTATTISDVNSLMKEIENVRQKGVAYERNENELDISCVGAALYFNGHVLGAFSISAPSYRVDEKREEEFAEAILLTKEAILSAIKN